MSGPHGLTLAETAWRLGRMRWVERRCFEVLGGWVATTEGSELRIGFAEQCYHHAWHAEVWAERFPQGYGADLDTATAAPPALVAAFAELAALEGDDARLAALVRVLLPAKVAAYRRWQAEATHVADGAFLRWVRVVLADEVEDWQAGVVLADRLVRPGPAPAEGRPADRPSAAVADAVRLAGEVGRIEGLLWVSGGLLGGDEDADGPGASTGADAGVPRPSGPGGTP